MLAVLALKLPCPLFRLSDEKKGCAKVGEEPRMFGVLEAVEPGKLSMQLARLPRDCAELHLSTREAHASVRRIDRGGYRFQDRSRTLSRSPVDAQRGVGAHHDELGEGSLR